MIDPTKIRCPICNKQVISQKDLIDHFHKTTETFLTNSYLEKIPLDYLSTNPKETNKLVVNGLIWDNIRNHACKGDLHSQGSSDD